MYKKKNYLFSLNYFAVLFLFSLYFSHFIKLCIKICTRKKIRMHLILEENTKLPTTIIRRVYHLCKPLETSPQKQQFYFFIVLFSFFTFKKIYICKTICNSFCHFTIPLIYLFYFFSHTRKRYEEKIVERKYVSAHNARNVCMIKLLCVHVHR